MDPFSLLSSQRGMYFPGDQNNNDSKHLTKKIDMALKRHSKRFSLV